MTESHFFFLNPVEFDHSDEVKAQENGDEPLTEKEILPEKIKYSFFKAHRGLMSPVFSNTQGVENGSSNFRYFGI